VAAFVALFLVAATGTASASSIETTSTVQVPVQVHVGGGGFCDPEGGNCTCIGAWVGTSFYGECGF
jgi:hypothetical protein